nr:hypothetical protein [Angustibacter aerolatus]
MRSSAAGTPGSPHAQIARQGIYDRERRLVGHEPAVPRRRRRHRRARGGAEPHRPGPARGDRRRRPRHLAGHRHHVRRLRRAAGSVTASRCS